MQQTDKQIGKKMLIRSYLLVQETWSNSCVHLQYEVQVNGTC